MSPALQDRFLTTGPPGKSLLYVYLQEHRDIWMSTLYHMLWAFDLLIIIKYKDREYHDHVRKRKIQCLVFEVLNSNLILVVISSCNPSKPHDL